MLTPEEHARLASLLDRMALGSRSTWDEDAGESRFALSRALARLSLNEEIEEHLNFEVRLRLAMHLSPANALAYNPANPSSRVALIRDYLISDLNVPEEGAEELAKDVSRLLYLWDEEREPLGKLRQRSLAKKALNCAHCRVSMDSVHHAHIAERRDEYKPLFMDLAWLTPELDHIDAVSALGTNSPTNLQLLCRFCNRGKGSGLGMRVETEMAHAGTHVNQQSAGHRATMLYYVILRDHRECQACGCVDKELTIRPIQDRGGYIRTNLRTYCYSCAEPESGSIGASD